MNEEKTAAGLPTEEVAFLRTCAEFEMKMASLYHYFESLFADNAPFSQLWQKTAREEENHARQFQLGVRLEGAGMKKVNADVTRVVASLQKLEKGVEKVMAARPSPEEALTLAIRLEEQLAALHMSSIVAFEDPGVKKMFQAMMGSDEGHVRMLKDALRELSSSKGNVP